MCASMKKSKEANWHTSQPDLSSLKSGPYCFLMFSSPALGMLHTILQPSTTASYPQQRHFIGTASFDRADDS